MEQDEDDKQHGGEVEAALPLAAGGEHQREEEDELAGGEKARPAVVGFAADGQRGGGEQGKQDVVHGNRGGKKAAL